MIETERLQLRNYTLTDAPFVRKLLNSEAWLKNIGDRNIKTDKDAENYIQKNYFNSYQKYGYGSYLVSLKETGKPIGSAGIHKRDSLEHPDIGYAFLPEFWNNGYAFEATEAVIQFALNQLNIEKIMAITLPENTSSIKLLRKLGLTEVGNYTYEAGENLLLFSV